MASGSNRNYNTNNFDDLQNQVDSVKGVMTQNIDKILQRGEKLEDLVDKTTDLETSAKKVKRKMWWKNIKMMIILGVVITIILGAIILALVLKFGGGGGDKNTTTTQPSSLPSSSPVPGIPPARLRRNF